MAVKTIAWVGAAVAALATALGAGAGNGTPVNPGSQNPLTLAVIGDVPYGSAQIAAFPAWIDAINRAPKVDLVAHVGDIKSGSSRCDDSYFALVADLFGTFRDPLVYTPGDNEWTDCHRPNNGGYDPLERLDAIRTTFFAEPGVTLGGRKKRVDAQPGYPEHVLWLQSQTAFAALHVVGSNNGLAPWTGNAAPTAAQLAEVEARIDATLAWIDRTFDAASEAEARGVVLLMQADTFEDVNETLEGYVEILDRIEARAAAFARPVLLLQGDSHSYVEDRPFAGAANVTRIVVEGSASASEWLQVTVDPRAPRLFAWERVAI